MSEVEFRNGDRVRMKGYTEENGAEVTGTVIDANYSRRGMIVRYDEGSGSGPDGIIQAKQDFDLLNREPEPTPQHDDNYPQVPDLPQVYTNDLHVKGVWARTENGYTIGWDESYLSDPTKRRTVLSLCDAYTAIAAYIRANEPQVDEAQVEALIAQLRAADIDRTGQSLLMDSEYHQIARHLLSAGVRVEVPDA